MGPPGGCSGQGDGDGTEGWGTGDQVRMIIGARFWWAWWRLITGLPSRVVAPAAVIELVRVLLMGTL